MQPRSLYRFGQEYAAEVIHLMLHGSFLVCSAYDVLVIHSP